MTRQSRSGTGSRGAIDKVALVSSRAMVEPSSGTQRVHQIGEVAEAIGLSLRTIRHYDEVGLVPPSGRTAGGFRIYTDDDIARLRLIKQMKPLDFTLEEMGDLLSTLDMARVETDPDRKRDFIDRLDMYAAAAAARCDKLREQLKAAEGLAHMLRDEVRDQRD